jgi:hypothetical protein
MLVDAMSASIDLGNAEEHKMNKLLGQVGAFRHIVMDNHKRLCAVRGDLVPVQAGHLRPLLFVRWKCLLRLQAQVGYFIFAHSS